MVKTYKSQAMTAVHKMMEGFHQSGAIDNQIMREFDVACLSRAPVLTPDEIKAICEHEAASPPVFPHRLRQCPGSGEGE